MSYPIKFLSLQKQELEYEVSVRGVKAADSVRELREQIVKISNILPSEDILESHLECSEDLNGAKESLTKAHNNVQSLKTRFDKSLYFRTENLLNHIYHRINRITVNPESSDLYKNTCSTFNTLYKELLSMKPSSAAPSSSVEKSQSVEPPASPIVSCERNIMADIGKLKYTGKTCVRAFIQKVEEFVISRGIPHEKILSFAYEIFTDDALHWYRCIKDKVKSWHELVQILKEDFSSKDYDYRLLAEIRSRTQGENENITIYLAIMHGMFSRLGKPMNDEDKLEILLHNIRPCYASTLASSSDIKSIEHLKKLCRNFENIQTCLTQFHDPPKATSNMVAPEFAYRGNPSTSNYFYKKQNTPYKSYENFKSTNPLKQTNLSIAAVSPNTPQVIKNTYCPRCRSNSHSLRQCSMPRFLICFKCGRKDVRYPECPDCNSTAKN